METAPQTTLAVENGSSPVPNGGPVVNQSVTSKSTPEQRAKWREKAKRRAEAKRAAAAGLASEVPATTPDPGQSQTQARSVAVVPWNPSVLAPLFQNGIPEVEKACVKSLVEIATPFDPQLAEDVKTDALWNPASKQTIIETGPVVLADILQRCGVKQENAPAVMFCTALGGILWSHFRLKAKLEEIAAEVAQQKKHIESLQKK
jgi:hypothetical protein